MSLKIVKVDWIDARTLWDVLTEEELKQENLIDVTTVGYLVEQNDHVIKISSMININNEKIFLKTSHIIPKCLVKSIKELKENE